MSFLCLTTGTVLGISRPIWMKRFRSRDEKLLWWAAWSTYEEDFKDQLSALVHCQKSCQGFA
ncbi:hypothetical protein H5410_009442 [Solanum commersonii]|uniref:Uncharacterized protein n=1 Tax=Solanum commersonii TaxID=4109 RepID=A0A9J6AI11_SOLCO|nr:hypothetical protein H5410_009442 [Solanum commersonii]